MAGGEERVVYLAGGCFWGIEHLMKALPGVTDTQTGYANGTGPDPASQATYKQVCSNTTGFRETVRVRFDPARITLDHILYALFEVIDPTLRNRQGADVGTQYQAGVYWEPSDAQTAKDVHRVCAWEAARHPGFAVEVKPLENFFEAEDYHQDYLDTHPDGYCHVPAAKIEELRALDFDENHYR